MSFFIPTREPKPSDIEIFLAKPDRTIIYKINERFNPSHAIRLGQLNEITFSIPYDIERNHGIIRYPVVDKIQQRYLLKIVAFGQEEWMVIDKITDHADDKELKEIHAYSLGYELANKIIYTWAGVYKNNEYTKISLNAQEVLNNVLSDTIWTIDYIDADFNVTYREFDFTNVTRLDAVYQIAETFGALIVWNTENRAISLYKIKNYGTNKGITFKEGKYLKTLKHEQKSDEMVTHFKAFGKDGLSLNRVNPTGTDFLVDYSYFIDEYATDELGNVTSHSKYMSDGLCQAIIDYQEKVNSYQGQFDTLLSQKETKQIELLTLESQLSDLETELVQIQDVIDAKASSGLDYSQELTDESNKKSEISSKEIEISNKESEITSIDNQINIIKTDISIETNFTTEQIIEKAQFEYERVWEDQNIYDDNILLERAKEEFAKLKSPKSVVEIDIVNFLAVEDCSQDWDKFNIGDKCNIKQNTIGIDAESQMIEFNIDYDNNSISVIVADTIFNHTDDDDIAEYISNSISTSATVNLNKTNWNQITSTNNNVQALLENEWSAAKNSIIGGLHNSVVTDRRGLTITSTDDPLKFLRANNGVLTITNDGGNTFKTAITGDKVVAEVLAGKLLVGQDLTIDASDTQGTKTFEVNGTGVTINGLALTITGGLPPDQLDPTFKESLVELNKNYTNGIRIDTANGIVVTKSNELVQSIFNATDGIKIQSRTSTTGSWQDRLYVDTNGKLVTKEVVADNITINSGTLNLQNLTVNGTLSGNNIDVSTLTVGDANITGTLSANKLNLNQNLKGVNVSENFKIDSSGNVNIKGNIEMNGGNITGASNIDIRSTVNIGNTLIMNGNSSSGGIRWGTGTYAPAIYVDPSGGSMSVHNGSGVLRLSGTQVFINNKDVSNGMVAVFG